MKKLLALFLGGLLFIGSMGNVLAEGDAGPFAAKNFSANVGLVTDYVFRGETQSRNQPAVQGGFDWGYDMFYVGVWASNVNFDFVGLDNAFLEIDYYGGIANTIGPFDYDVSFWYYTYPGNDAANDLDYIEIVPTLSYTFADAPLEPTVGFQYAYSPDYFNEEGTGNNFQGSLALTLPMGFGIDGWLGYQEIDGDDLGTDIEWTYWSVGLTKSVVGFDMDLRYHGASEDSDIQWLANSDLDQDTFTFGISRSF